MTTFTEGPWKFKPKGMFADYGNINGVGWEALANVVIRMEGSDTDSIEGLANARLIEAAPTMYELLKTVVQESDNTVGVLSEINKLLREIE